MIPIEKIQALAFHHRATIPASYLDAFGHMNIQWYMALFNDSIFSMSTWLGMDADYFETNNTAMFALEHHIKYLAEVSASETVALYSRHFARTEKRVHLMHFMVNESRGVLAATLEMVAMHMDRGERRSRPFLPHIAQRIDEQIVQDGQLDWQIPLAQRMNP